MFFIGMHRLNLSHEASVKVLLPRLPSYVTSDNFVVVTKDMGGDGCIDFTFYLNRTSGNDYICLVSGCSLTPIVNLTTPAPSACKTIFIMPFGLVEQVALDFNNDGLGDIAFLSTTTSGGSYIYLVNGRNDWPSVINLASDSNHTILINNLQSWRMASNDINNDGFMDLRIRINSNVPFDKPSYVIYCNNHMPPVTIVPDSPGYGFNITSANNFVIDFTDALYGTTGNFLISDNKGLSYFFPPMIYNQSSYNTTELIPTALVTVNGFMDLLSPSRYGDLNNNGFPDTIFMGSEALYVAYDIVQHSIIDESNSSLFSLLAYNVSGSRPFMCADVNSDGASDVVVLDTSFNNSSGRAFIIYGIPPLSPSATTSTTATTTTTPSSTVSLSSSLSRSLANSSISNSGNISPFSSPITSKSTLKPATTTKSKTITSSPDASKTPVFPPDKVLHPKSKV